LGPKISFASARHSTKNEEDTKAGTSPEKSKARAFGRDRELRDKEVREKGRFDKANGNADDARAYAGFRKGYEKKVEDADDAGSEEAELRRRAKLDQPWFRGERKAQDDHDGTPEPSGDRGWRERERRADRGERNDRGDRDWQRGGRAEQDPQWMREDSKAEELAMHTQEDFEKWKQSMKGGAHDEDDEHQASSTNVMFDSGVVQAAVVSSGKQVSLGDPTSVFNLWSEPRREEREGSVSTPKTASKPKSSRFTSFFGPTASEPISQPHQQIQHSQPREQVAVQESTYSKAPSSSPPPPLASSASERQAPVGENNEALAFQKVLQMLKVGNGLSQVGDGHGASRAFASAPMPQQLPVPTVVSSQTRAPRSISIASAQPPPAPTRNVQSAAPQLLPAQHAEQAQQFQQAQQAQRPPVDNRNSEFLLKLMQQPQQVRTPFTEGQIYGQSYNQQKNPGELAALLNNLNLSHGGPPQQVSGPPSGMHKQDRHYTPQQHMASQVTQAQVGVDERIAGMHPRHLPTEEHRFPPGFQQGLLFPNGRSMTMPEILPVPHLPPSQGLPPHLIHQQGRAGPPPPGFYNPQPQRGGLPPQYYGQGLPPHLMAAHMPQSYIPQPPPGMQQQQGRRPPSIQMQPGFDIYANIEAVRREHPGQQILPGQYPQYMK
jgi:hypothetical protein